MTAELRQIEMDRLVPTKDNPRTALDEKSQVFNDLIASIKGDGVRVPLQARPIPYNRQEAKEPKGLYEVLDGGRRLAAAKAAGLATVPVLVHLGMSDEDAFKLVLASNFAREDLTPIEQGRAVEILLQKYAADVKAVAAALGQSERWVAQRSQLSRLTDDWKTTLNKRGFRAELSAAALLLIARLPAEYQKDLLRRDEWWWKQYKTAKALEQEIDELFVHRLRSAPWKAGDETLVPDAGSCTTCAKRSSCEGLLWHDPDEDVTKTDQCLDVGCWERKRAAYTDRRFRELKAEHPEAVAVKHTTHLDRDEESRLTKRFGEVKEHWNVADAKKNDAGAVPALVVNGPAAGTLRWVKVSGERRTAPRRGPQTPTEKRAALARKRRMYVLRQVKQKLQESAPPAFAEALACVYGISIQTPYDRGGKWKLLARLVASPAEARAEFWKGVLRGLCSEELTPRYGDASAQISNARELGKLFDWNIAAIEREAEGKFEPAKPKVTRKDTKEKKKRTAKDAKDAKAETGSQKPGQAGILVLRDKYRGIAAGRHDGVELVTAEKRGFWCRFNGQEKARFIPARLAEWTPAEAVASGQ